MFQISKRVIEVVELELDPAAARGVRGVGDALAPGALQDLSIVVRHDHLNAERRIDDAVVDGHGVVNDALNVGVACVPSVVKHWR